MTRKLSDEYTSVCLTCYNKTYDTEPHACRRNAAHGEMRLIERSDLAPEFTPYKLTGERIKVQFGGLNGKPGEVKTGTVGQTTGWRPAYLLVLTSRSLGSSWLLSERDHVIGVKVGKVYRKPWRSTNYRREDGTEPYANVEHWNTAYWKEREEASEGSRGYRRDEA